MNQEKYDQENNTFNKSCQSETLLTVSEFLDIVNQSMSSVTFSIKGEISSFSFRKHAYFSLKDNNDGSMVNCFMWGSDYNICGVNVKEGLDVIIHGFPEVYKPTGRLTFRASSIELVGEGALKKAYEELKDKFLEEGLFDVERKKPMPLLPINIGVITSKYGAVINDLLTNLGTYGLKISLFDSRVEGVLAIKELKKAIDYFKNKPIDLLVIIRGGGSLESLQPFNNEVLIRSLVDYSVPIICGIGHDKDVPLISLVSDLSVSTPTAVAREINKSWDKSIENIQTTSTHIIDQFSLILFNKSNIIDKNMNLILTFYNNIRHYFDKLLAETKKSISIFEFSINHTKTLLAKDINITFQYFESFIDKVSFRIASQEKEIFKNNPKSVLKKGYSVLTYNKKVVRSIKQVNKGNILNVRVEDGNILTSVIEESNKE
ncbi:MAG: exodeoxyribonuclease VII large subunit [Caldisericia bacterium]|nr:exodeoxyribonuclease VII large subunit [Caldisericia bacterium]